MDEEDAGELDMPDNEQETKEAPPPPDPSRGEGPEDRRAHGRPEAPPGGVRELQETGPQRGGREGQGRRGGRRARPPTAHGHFRQGPRGRREERIPRTAQERAREHTSATPPNAPKAGAEGGQDRRDGSTRSSTRPSCARNARTWTTGGYSRCTRKGTRWDPRSYERQRSEVSKSVKTGETEDTHDTQESQSEERGE